MYTELKITLLHIVSDFPIENVFNLCPTKHQKIPNDKSSFWV